VVGADDVQAELRFVRRALDRGEGTKMQALFPEGFLFSHALYGLAWVEQGLAAPPGDPRRVRAVDEARWALGRATSAEGQAPFTESLSPRFGVFYAGWTNWFRAGILRLSRDADRDAEMVAEFDRQCEELARAFDENPATPFLMSYPGSAWPVDSVVAVASLQLHDVLEPPRFAATIAAWLARARDRLDPSTGLIPHRVDAALGRPIETARGSSQSVLLRFLVEIDPAWGSEQYGLFWRRFVTTRLGLPGVREYPDGVAHEGDVDSGPLLAGVSMSATVVTRGTASIYRDEEMAGALAQTMELFGFPISLGGEKRYALGLFPVGDAFIAWSHGARRWSDGQGADLPAYPRLLSPLWRMPTHAALAVAAALVVWGFFLRPRMRRKADILTTRTK
jgi:hypothetical protein